MSVSRFRSVWCLRIDVHTILLSFSAKIPQAWKDALDKAVSAGKIPNIPNSNANDGDPKYPNNLDPNSKTVCSSTAKCRQDVDYVIWDAPDGVWASSFDDGPQLATSRLVKFLDDNNVTTTHFLIGVNIVGFVDQFKEILQSGNDLAVHTWVGSPSCDLHSKLVA
jgi:hypothetical protein